MLRTILRGKLDVGIGAEDFASLRLPLGFDFKLFSLPLRILNVCRCCLWSLNSLVSR